MKVDFLAYNQTNSLKNTQRNTSNKNNSPAAVFTDEEDAIFTAIERNEIQENLNDGDDAIFQSIETDEPSEPTHANHENRYVLLLWRMSSINSQYWA